MALCQGEARAGGENNAELNRKAEEQADGQPWLLFTPVWPPIGQEPPRCHPQVSWT